MALWNSLRSLFGGARAPVPSQSAPVAARSAGVAPPAVDEAAWPSQGPCQAPEALPADPLPALVARFGASLLGGGDPLPQPVSTAERDALARLHALAERGLDTRTVPRLPAVLPRLMALVRRDEVSPRELCELLARDPVLVGEVVRLANSPRYRTQRRIEDLGGALMLLGQLGLSQLVMRAAVRPIFMVTQGRLGKAAAGRLWELSERCGQACGSRRAGCPDAFSAYLAGTAVPIGLIVALRVLDQGAPVVAPGSHVFHAGLWRQALRLSAQAVRQWDFPVEVTVALGNLAAPSMGATEAADDPLTQALRQALAMALTVALSQAEGVERETLPISVDTVRVVEPDCLTSRTVAA